MKDFPGAGKKFQKFKEKDCYVVWNLDDTVIRKILAHYNRINHFQNYVWTWATNIISAKNVWISMYKLPTLKELNELGKVVTKKKGPRDAILKKSGR